MRRVHLLAGALGVLAFVITGQIMLRHQPPLDGLGDSVRLMFRSRHIYILASGLVNLMLGVYMERAAGWRAGVQTAGSTLVLLSLPLLIWAFAAEPGHGLPDGIRWSACGLYVLFGGCVAHAASAARRL